MKEPPQHPTATIRQMHRASTRFGSSSSLLLLFTVVICILDSLPSGEKSFVFPSSHSVFGSHRRHSVAMARPKNFKQFKKKEKIREKSSMKRKISKAAGLGKRRSNIRDGDTAYQSKATMEELLNEVSTGSVSVSLDPLDPRALTDALLRQSGGKVQPTKKGPVKRTAADVDAKASREEAKAQHPELEEEDYEAEGEEAEMDEEEEEEEAAGPIMNPKRPILAENVDSLPASIPIEQLLKKKNVDQADIGDAFAQYGYTKEGEPFSFWKEHKIHPLLMRGLQDCGFSHPTPIQKESLPAALEAPMTKDIVVSSETGSGKTLIFALPIIQSVLRGCNCVTNPAGIRFQKRKRNREGQVNTDNITTQKAIPQSETILHTLVLSPTRELAQQITLCMQKLAKSVDRSLLRVGCIVGGMAPHKQQRVLNKHPHILICTPGRMWDLIAKNEGCFLGHSISKRLSFLVLDEADRLLQSGHFDQLKLILDRIHSDMLPTGRAAMDTTVGTEEGDEYGGPVEYDEATGEFVPIKQLPREGETESDDSGAEGGATTAGGNKVKLAKDRPRPMKVPPPPHSNHRIITFVTSATLSLDLNYQRKDVKGDRTIIRTKNANTMGQVLAALNIRHHQCLRFELQPQTGVVAKLHETYLRCPEKTKELYLYYFLHKYRERTIIFVNAISMLRRLTKIIEILGIPCSSLHASMQQRQRLGYIDKFKSGERRVLVATDIASRGLDVEGVKYVVHYQLPRSTDAYIHRCGRTARCGGTGFSMAMVDAKEWASFQKLMQSMHRTEAMEVFSVEQVILHHLHPHLQIALQIDKLTKEVTKTSANQRWVKSTSGQAELDADDMIVDDMDDVNKEKVKAIKQLQKRLTAMTRRDLEIGHKGSFRSAPKAIGAESALKKYQDRAARQLYKTE